VYQGEREEGGAVGGEEASGYTEAYVKVLCSASSSVCVFACADDTDVDEEEEEDAYWSNKLQSYGFEVAEAPIVKCAEVRRESNHHC
jgi:hypothetical protein